MQKKTDEMWEEYYFIKNKFRQKKVQANEIIEDVKKISQMAVDSAKNTSVRKEYEELGDIFYSCEEFLMEEFGKFSNIVFPVYKV